MYVMITYMSNETKICSRCKKDKNLDDFYDTKKGKAYWCKQCNLDAAKALYKKRCEEDPEFSKRRYEKYYPKSGSEARRKYSLQKKYGLSIEEFRKMYADQQELCLICGEHMKESKGAVVDHCHKTGKIRGLLHYRCNTALGYFRDSPEICIKAAEYLEKHRKV
jgi:hypothetical protein